MNLSEDAQVVLLLCSQMTLAGQVGLSPLILREWNVLARKIAASELKRPGALLQMNAAALARAFALPAPEAARYARLLARREALQAEVERLGRMGIDPLTRADGAYPARLRQRLKDSAPVVLFTSGSPELLDCPGAVVVGSRQVSAAGQACAAFVGGALARPGFTVISGGARGADWAAMSAAFGAGGSVAGILAVSLEQAAQATEYREWLASGRLCLLAPYVSNAEFSTGAAMGRNRLIYALAEQAVVAACEPGAGGTWEGASEALKAGWLPVFACQYAGAPAGNALLIEKGALPLPYPFPGGASRLPGWLNEQAGQWRGGKPSAQPALF